MSYKLKKSYRKQGYDYSINGYYFVTVCTKNRKNYLGKIENYEMKLSIIGKIVAKFWLEIPKHFRNVFLDNWIIMPNHLHGIIKIEDRNQLMFSNHININCRNAPWRVLQNKENTPWRVPTRVGPLTRNSISSIVNHFKGNVKRFCNKKGLEYFTWQDRFYDRIIRDEEELHNIQNYIYYNPLNWDKDRNNFENLLM